MERKNVIIVGGGPAGLMAANMLSSEYHVAIYDKEKNLGQKFLLAGKGGFNLTNEEQGTELISKYSPAGFMNKALLDFDTSALRQWFSNLGVPTFIGSSGRVFPDKDIKPIDILKKIKAKLIKQGVQVQLQHEFVSFDNEKHITFRNQEKELVLEADYILFALGGASWPVTGSTGTWLSVFESMGIGVDPFQASNCGINISWSEAFKENHSGKPIKNIRLFNNDFEVKGEVLITEYGMEGNALYPMVPSIRNMFNANKQACIYIDFKPQNTEEHLLRKLRGSVIKSKNYGKFFHLNTAQLALIKGYTSKENYLSPTQFIRSIKKLAIPVDSLRPVEEAISSVGGIRLEEVKDDFSLKKYPWIFTIGEMLDWDAPTGGFLLQGCFSMGHHAANSILQKQ